jgi:hypothetical protein
MLSPLEIPSLRLAIARFTGAKARVGTAIAL